MPKSRFLLVVAVAIGVMVSSSPAICADSHAAPFLRMGVGARALGMGGAFTAIADDATAAYWNPAGLVKIENIEATFMYAANMAVDRQINYFAYAQWLGVGGLGVSWLNAGMGDMPRRDGSGGFQGTDEYADNAIMFSYGMEVGSLMLGGTAKVLHQNVMNITETGFGLDLGGMFNVNDNVSAGLMIRDIGSQYGDVNVPFDWRFGSAVKALDGALTVGIDVDKVQQIDNFDIHLGAEYGMEVRPGYHAFFRTGLNSVEDKAFTAGLGIRVPYIQFDYTYMTEQDEVVLGNNHRISVTARF
ncbi:MAG: PorV/PorQ family protein [Candidatus Eisenbacteria bacterium]